MTDVAPALQASRAGPREAAVREIVALMYQATELLDDLTIEACEQGYVPSERVIEMSQEFRQGIQRYADLQDRSERAQPEASPNEEM